MSQISWTINTPPWANPTGAAPVPPLCVSLAPEQKKSKSVILRLKNCEGRTCSQVSGWIKKPQTTLQTKWRLKVWTFEALFFEQKLNPTSQRMNRFRYFLNGHWNTLKNGYDSKISKKPLNAYIPKDPWNSLHNKGLAKIAHILGIP